MNFEESIGTDFVSMCKKAAMLSNTGARSCLPASWTRMSGGPGYRTIHHNRIARHTVSAEKLGNHLAS